MTVHFDHAAHVATMWLPQLSPTHATVVSTLAALAFCAVLIGAIAWMFADGVASLARASRSSERTRRSGSSPTSPRSSRARRPDRSGTGPGATCWIGERQPDG